MDEQLLAAFRAGDPLSRPASVKVETKWASGRFDSAPSASVFPLDGGPMSRSHTGSPGSRLAATVAMAARNKRVDAHAPQSGSSSERLSGNGSPGFSFDITNNRS